VDDGVGHVDGMHQGDDTGVEGEERQHRAGHIADGEFGVARPGGGELPGELFDADGEGDDRHAHRRFRPPGDVDEIAGPVDEELAANHQQAQADGEPADRSGSGGWVLEGFGGFAFRFDGHALPAEAPQVADGEAVAGDEDGAVGAAETTVEGEPGEQRTAGRGHRQQGGHGRADPHRGDQRGDAEGEGDGDHGRPQDGAQGDAGAVVAGGGGAHEEVLGIEPDEDHRDGERGQAHGERDSHRRRHQAFGGDEDQPQPHQGHDQIEGDRPHACVSLAAGPRRTGRVPHWRR